MSTTEQAPRWRLREPHYLNVPGTEWEYKEQDRSSGRQGRKLFTVPLLLDPRDPSDHNYPGEVIVTHGGLGQGPKDVIFIGDPTPAMEPVNEAAMTISKKFEGKWKHPIETLPENYSQSLLAQFEAQLADAVNKAGGIPNTPVSGVSQEQFTELQRQVQALMEQNAALMAQLTEKSTAGRRV